MGRIRIDLQWGPGDSARGLWRLVAAAIKQAASGRADRRYLSGVGHPAVQLAPPAPPPPSGNAVAGRIERAHNSLNAGMEAWLAWLGDRNKRARSIEKFRSTVEAAVRETGWTDVSHLSYDAISGYLGEQRRARNWKPATYNACLSCFRSFTRYLVASGKLLKDPLALAVAADSDVAEGSRACTVAEARAIVREAMIRQQTDRRASGNRALYWHCLFSMGLRVDEPAKWRWGQLLLDGEIPSILWLPNQHKNRRRVEIAIAPETARLLREWRGQVPGGKEDPVFSTIPPRTTFRVDRDRAGVVELDERGRRCSPHSARKFFETAMITANVNPRMVDFLMRHTISVADRYFDASLKEQAAALSLLPELWPQKNEKCVHEDLTSTGMGAEDVPATPNPRNSQSNAAPSAGLQVSLPIESDRRAAFDRELLTSPAPQGGRVSRDQATKLCPVMPITGSNLVDRSAVAGLLAAAANAARKGADVTGLLDALVGWLEGAACVDPRSTG